MRRAVYACALAGLLSVTLIAMVDYVGVDTVQRYIPFANLASIVAAILVFFVLTALLVMRGVPRVIELVRRADMYNPLPCLPIALKRKSVLVCAAVIFVCWIPYLILQYPCAMFSDTYDQLYQFQTNAPTFYVFLGEYTNAEFIDHHPVFDTLLFGAFSWMGDMLGSQNIGMFAYSVFQCGLTSFVLALCCCYLCRLGVPKVFRLSSLAFVALFPIIPLWATCMGKDPLFSTFYALYFLMYIEAFRSQGKALSQSRFLLAFVAVAGLCILTKKTGVYLVALPMFALLLANRALWKPILAATVAPAALFFCLLPVVVYPLIGGVEPGGKQEAFGALYQQVITVIRAEDNDVTAEERRAVDGVLYTDLCCLTYESSLVDGVKNRTKIAISPHNYLDFFSAYLSIGVRHPIEYARSIANVCAPLVCPGAGLDYYGTCETQQKWANSFDEALNGDKVNFAFYKPEPIRTWEANVEAAYLNLVETNPLAAILLSRGLFGGWIPFCCILLAACNNRRYWVAYAPIIVSIAVLVVSPAGSTRYMLPLLYVLPLMLGLLHLSFRGKRAVP